MRNSEGGPQQVEQDQILNPGQEIAPTKTSGISTLKNLASKIPNVYFSFSIAMTNADPHAQDYYSHFVDLAQANVQMQEMERPTIDTVVGIFSYGLYPEVMIETGAIKSSFAPKNGKEYTEEDVQVLFALFKKWKDAGINTAVFSWERVQKNPLEVDPEHRDWRDRFFNWVINDAAKRCDNPHPELGLMNILEGDSVIDLSKARIDHDIAHMQEHYFPNKSYVKDVDGEPVVVIFGQDIEPTIAQRWNQAAEEHNIQPIVQKTLLDKLFPHADDVMRFDYGMDFLGIIAPYRLSIIHNGDIEERGVANITASYRKKGDLKRLPYRPNQFRTDLQEAINSKARYILLKSDGEILEGTSITTAQLGIMREELVVKRSNLFNLIDSSSDCILPPREVREESIVFLPKAA